jgi:hypothetical protein
MNQEDHVMLYVGIDQHRQQLIVRVVGSFQNPRQKIPPGARKRGRVRERERVEVAIDATSTWP